MKPAGRVEKPRGSVVWITGLAGSGKTTAATRLVARLRNAGRPTVLLDGDELRRSIATDLGYDLADRRHCAWRYARLATTLARQDLTIVVATISMFETVRRWNRRHAPRYVEVYLRRAVPARRTRARNVVGLDVPFEEPRAPDLVFEVPGTAPAVIAARIEARMRRGR